MLAESQARYINAFVFLAVFLQWVMQTEVSELITPVLSYQQIIDGLSGALMVLDQAGRIEFANPAAEVLFDTSIKRLKGIGVELLFGGQPEEIALIHLVRDSGQRFSKREAQMINLSGASLIVDYSVAALNDGLLLMEVHPRDRLLRIEREEELLNHHATARSLIRGLSHEIKNPLGGIRGAAQLLERELPDEELKEFTRIIIDETDRLRNLVDRMMGPYRKPKIQQVNIHEVLEHVRALIDVEAEGQIQLIRDYDPSIPEFSGDYEQIIQAVLNIARNAFQALQENVIASPQICLRTRAIRRITLGTEMHRLVCSVEIIDNGPGIPEQILSTVFYPMVTGRAEGTGLGLSIAQSIINQHQGLIECTSVPGRTSFQIYIPLESKDGGDS